MKLIVYLASAGVAIACTCGTITPEAALAGSDAVFSGTAETIEVLSPTNAWANVKVTFRPRDVWKGTNAPLVIYTASSQTICGYTFLRGSNYLVYAQQTSRAGRPILTTDLCSRTRALSEAAADLQVLRSRKPNER
jgi:hypothetical protein